MITGCNIWMICLKLNWFFYDPSWMLELSEFVWMIRSSVWVGFNNFLLIDATDRSKISSVQKRLFFAVSLYPLSFFADTPFKLFKWKVTWNYVDSQINIYEIACLRFWKEISPSYFLQPSPPIQSRYLWNKYLLKNLNINFNKKIKTSPPFLFFSNLEQKWGCMGIQWEPVLALNLFFSRTFNIFTCDLYRYSSYWYPGLKQLLDRFHYSELLL